MHAYTDSAGHITPVVTRPPNLTWVRLKAAVRQRTAWVYTTDLVSLLPREMDPGPIQLSLMTYAAGHVPRSNAILSLLDTLPEGWEVVLVAEPGVRIDIEAEHARPLIRLHNTIHLGYARSLLKMLHWASGERLLFMSAGWTLTSNAVSQIASFLSTAIEPQLLCTRVDANHHKHHVPTPGSLFGYDQDYACLFSRETYDRAGGIQEGLGDAALWHLYYRMEKLAAVRHAEPPLLAANRAVKPGEHLQRRAQQDWARIALRNSTMRATRASLSEAAVYYRTGLRMTMSGDADHARALFAKAIRRAPFTWRLHRAWFGARLLSSPLFNINDRAAIADEGPREVHFDVAALNRATGSTQGTQVLCNPGQHEAGHCVYGPYYQIPKSGAYAIEYEIKASGLDAGSTQPLFTIDVYDNHSDRILKIQRFTSGELAPDNIYRMELALEHAQVLEMRVYWHGHCALTVSGLRLLLLD